MSISSLQLKMATALKIGLLFLAVIHVPYAYSAEDQTIEPRRTGKEITEAVLRKLAKSKIFPEDNSFLVRLAYTETRFGENDDTFRNDYFGGVWAVEESVFQLTKTEKLYPQTTSIKLKFGIDWNSTTWQDLLKPMHSGIAAALYFKRVNAEMKEPIPDTVTAQANYWIKYYRPLGQVKQFEDDAEELRNQTKCRGKMDLCIVLDSSGSINQLNPNNYRKAKDFTAQMIESFSLDFTRIGMLIFSDNPREIFPIRNNNTIQELATKARNAAYLNSGTRTDLAIKQAINLFNAAESAEGVPKIMTVFTDGNSDRGSDLPGAIAAIYNNSIKSVSIGIGHSINYQELLDIALNDTSSVFTLTDFASLQDFLQKITTVACETPQEPALNETYTDSLVQDEVRPYRIEPPPEGITINVSVVAGRMQGFWSHSVEFPSSVLNDGVINGLTWIPAPPGIINATRSRQSEGGEGGEEEEEPLTNIYFTIQGLEATNNYTVSMVEGNTAGNDDQNSASLASFANIFIIACTTIHVLFV